MAGLAIPLAMTGLSALAGLFGNRKQTTTGSTNSSGTNTQNSVQDVDLTNMPEYAPEVWGSILEALGTLRKNAANSTDLSGYTTQGLQSINSGADMKRRAMENIMAAKGLSYSPAAAHATGRVESGRIGEQVNFMNSLPLLQRQMQNEDLSSLTSFLTALPTGSRQKGTTVQNTTGNWNQQGSSQQTNPGNMLGGLFSGLGSGLAFTAGNKMWPGQG